MGLVIVVLGLFAAWAAGQSPSDPPSDGSEKNSERIAYLVKQLDADSFAERDQASQELLASGEPAVPALADALKDGSAERRVRAAYLLEQYPSFDLVSIHLLRVLDGTQGTTARTLLRSRCIAQLEMAADLPNVDRLLKFWGTDRDRYRIEALTAFQEAKSSGELKQMIEPLMHLRDKASRFSQLTSRLEALSIPTDQQHTAGYALAEALAQGLRHNHSEQVAFAISFVEGFEQLVRTLQERRRTPHEIRQEVLNRVSWSQGAMRFALQLDDPQSHASQFVTCRLKLDATQVREGFFEGIRSADSSEFSKGVGRIHIIQLADDALRQWPQDIQAPVISDLLAAVAKCAERGDKTKALVYLQAIEACRQMVAVNLDLQTGIGQALAERLLASAHAEPNHRGYHPVMAVHNRLVAMIGRGITPQHEAYPRELCQRYLAVSPKPLPEAERLALDRYVQIVEELSAGKADLGSADMTGYLAAVRVKIVEQPQALAIELERVRKETPSSRP